MAGLVLVSFSCYKFISGLAAQSLNCFSFFQLLQNVSGIIHGQFLVLVSFSCYNPEGVGSQTHFSRFSFFQLLLIENHDLILKNRF